MAVLALVACRNNEGRSAPSATPSTQEKPSQTADESGIVQGQETPEVTRNAPPRKGGPVQLETIELPQGFRIALVSDQVPNARSLALAPDGTIFVSTRQLDRVYALRMPTATARPRT